MGRQMSDLIRRTITWILLAPLVLAFYLLVINLGVHCLVYQWGALWGEHPCLPWLEPRYPRDIVTQDTVEYPPYYIPDTLIVGEGVGNQEIGGEHEQTSSER